MQQAALRDALSGALPDRVAWDAASLIAYRADLWPRGQIAKRFDALPGVPPLAVAFPEEATDLEALLEICRAHGVALIPYGAGSGVIGGTLPVGPSVVADMRRMNRLLGVDPRRRVASVEAGKLGEELEDELRALGWTLGHYPSSIHCSTVGGYAATRSAGQFSSRYGKIEDMIEGLKVLTPGEGWLELDRSTEATAGTNFLDLIVGSEGTLGLIQRVDLRVHRRPEEERYRGLVFRTQEAGLEGMRAVMQSGLRPSVLRLYDPFDSLVALRHGSGGDDPASDREAARLPAAFEPVMDLLDGVSGRLQRRGLRELLRRPGLTNRLIDGLLRRTMMIIGFEGGRGDGERDMAAALPLLYGQGGEDLGEEPGLRWLRRRHSVSFKQAPIFSLGGFVDTMEVATSWSNLRRLYDSVRAALRDQVFLMAHFSHAYPDGCSIYFTMAGLRDDGARATELYDRMWRRGAGASLSAGGTLSHHHGVGLAKRPFLSRELSHGEVPFQAVKRLLDPEGLLNPGKLWSAP